jgi:hypothetical protein
VVLSAYVAKPLARSTATTTVIRTQYLLYSPLLNDLLTRIVFVYNSSACLFCFSSQQHVLPTLREEMTIEATTTAAVATAATPRRRRASGFARTTAFLLVAAVVLADVIRVCEYRYYGLYIIPNL